MAINNKKDKDTSVLNLADQEPQKEKKTPKGPGIGDSKGDGQGVDIIPTSDYKINQDGKKFKAHRIVFNKGEDDNKNVGVAEEMKMTYKQLAEVLAKNADAGKWIHDFVHSDNPKFEGKSKEMRKKMALAAYYAKQQQTEEVVDEAKYDGYKSASADKDHEYHVHRKSGAFAKDFEHNPGDVYHSLKDAKTVADNMKKGNKHLNVQTKITKHPRAKLAGPQGHLPEELKGGQVKLDKNHNGKLDADDFKKLRKEDMNEQLHPEADKVLKHIKPEHHAKYTSDLAKGTYKGDYADRTAVLKAAEKAGHLKESWDAMIAHSKEMSNNANKSKTKTYHDVKKTSTGTVYTKQFDKDGTSKGTGGDAAAKAENAPKRGRGRPKKDKFAESVEMLMSLSEEQFDEMMEEGFDAFFEAFEQLDELSKTTLGSYAKKASVDAKFKGFDAGFLQGDAMAHAKRMGDGADAGSVEDARAHSRLRGVKKAIDRLTK